MEEDNLVRHVVTFLCDKVESDFKIDIEYPIGRSKNVQKVIFVNVSDENNEIVFTFVLKALGKTIYRNYFVNCYHNEIVLYTVGFPAFTRPNSKYVLPKCLDAKPEVLSNIGVEITYLALENLCAKGFKMSVRNDVLKQDEILCALSALGEFHADCYSFKMQSPEKFQDVMSHIIELQTGSEEDEYHSSWLIWREVVFYCTIERFIQNCNANELVERAKYLIKILNTVGLMKLIKVISKPKEPLSVLCHGDFNRSNLMFRYDNENKPIACAFIDFQISSIASPAKDLFSLIFLNIKNSKDRRDLWEDMWCAYKDTLVARICKNTTINANDLPPEFCFDSLQEDFNYNCFASLPNIISFIYSYSEESNSVIEIQKKHVEEKREYLQENNEILMKSNTVSEFDYDFYSNALKDLESENIHYRIDGLLKEYFLYYYYEYPSSLFEY